jgi:LPXTG-motif cell wall-anchored protein
VQPSVAPTNSPIPTTSNTKKIALIVGGVLLLGVAAYFYSKRNK